ncbi:MAG: DUF1538 domain-containing protein [Anaerotignum sp.]|nr:DUF1538 domain-containing protein [Anaerotignum sp.]
MESLASVLPLTAIVLLLSVTLMPLSSGALVLFLFGALLLIVGMGFFTMGADMSMMPMGEGIGMQMSQAKNVGSPLFVCFVLGALITIAEPDLQVLAEQVPAIPNNILIFSVAAGVGLFLMIAQIRIFFHIPLAKMLCVFYPLVFILAFFAPDSFIPVSFDSGGVTTGPVTVPFIMALGIGLATLRSDKNSREDSFGLISLCSIGPILAVMLLGIFYEPDSALYSSTLIPEVETTRDAAMLFAHAIPEYFHEVAVALVPIAGAFFIFQILYKRYKKHQLLRVIFGFIFTYIGLAMFLCGVNVGFMPVGQIIGGGIADSAFKWLLIPIGMVIGYFIVAAEPAVHVLTKQVEEISNGFVTAKMMQTALSVGVCISVGIAMLRILTGISILWFLIPGYAFALILTRYVSPIFTGIAFDSGGVASGPMTATFLLPFAMGACEAVGGNVMTDAFGIVAMVAMTPLITIQMMGFITQMKERAKQHFIAVQLNQLEDDILYFD